MRGLIVLSRQGRQWCFRLAEEAQVSAVTRLCLALGISAWPALTELDVKGL